MFDCAPVLRAAVLIVTMGGSGLLLTACGGIGQSEGSSSNLNNPPVFVTPTRFVVPENTRNIATLAATDADGDTITYEIIGGDDQERFSLDGQSGAFSFTNNPNYEFPNDSDRDNQYVVRIQATDQSNTHKQTITVVVSDVNENLSFRSPNRVLVEELNTAVVVLKTNDPENIRTTFNITGGADEALFSLDPNTGELTFVSAPDFDNPGDSDGDNQYAVSVSAFDGANTITQNLTVIVHRKIGVDLFSDIKLLTFDWPPYFGATHYKVFLNPDGASGFTQLGTDLTGHQLTLDIPVHLTDWLNATYLVEAHDDAGIIGFSDQLAITDHLLTTIGYIKASNTDAEDAFGVTVALSADGNTLAVGAPGEDSDSGLINGDQDDNSAAESGAVYVYARDGDSWQQQAYLKSLDGDSASQFGASIALDGDGDTLVVGAPGKIVVISDPVDDGIDETIILPDTGAAYVFTRHDGSWGQIATLTGNDSTADHRFGEAVTLNEDGGIIMVGAPGTADGGAVYEFTRDGDEWLQETLIIADNADPDDRFGATVILNDAGDILAVGAPDEDGNATAIDGPVNDDAPDAGAVYLFSRNITLGWQQQAYVKPSNTSAGQRFGASIALNDAADVLAVGAWGESGIGTGVNGDPTQDVAFAQSGAAYLFSFEDALWGQRAYIKAPEPALSDQFGSNVALNAAGNLLAVSAPLEDGGSIAMHGDAFDDSQPDAGAVYLYHQPPPQATEETSEWRYQNYVKAANTGPFDHFGASVAFADDGNTLAIGAPGEASATTGIGGNRDDDSATDAGAAYLY